MSSIIQIDFANVPSNIKLLEKEKKTKKIYFKSENAHLDDEKTKEFSDYVLPLPYDEYISIAKGSSEELKIFRYYEPEKMQPVHINLFKNNSSIANTDLGDSGWIGAAPAGSFLVEFDEPVTISNSRSSYVYYEELPPPEIIQVDKAPSTTSLNEVTNYINKTTESIKSCKSYIAYVINNKGGSATDTETLESLINKLKDIKF